MTARRTDPLLSVIVVVYNMRREGRRTLHSLSARGSLRRLGEESEAGTGDSNDNASDDP